MDNNPLISVLVTSYNHAPYIKACIDSILNQTYRQFHLKVIDDASTDGTAEILQSYGERIELHVRQKNLGVEKHCNTINDGIKNARGEFFYRIDSDDFIEPDYFERMIAAWESDRSLDWICGGLNVVNRHGRITDIWDYRDWPTDPERAITRGWQTCSVLMPHNGLFRTEFLRSNNIYFEHFPYGWGEDVFFTIKGMLARPNIRLLPHPGFNWRTHGANNSCDVERRIKLVLAVKEYYIEHIPTRMYLNHPQLAAHKSESDEYESTRWFIIAADLLAAKHNFRVPDIFSSEKSSREIEEYSSLFDDPIRNYAARSLEYSQMHKDQIDLLLQRLKNDEQINEGRRLLKLGDFRKASQKFSNALVASPRSVQALRGMGEACFGLGDAEQAEYHTSRAIEIAPNDIVSVNNSGVIAHSRGNLRSAESRFLNGLSLNRNSRTVHLNLLNLYASDSTSALLGPTQKQQLLKSVRLLSEDSEEGAHQELMRENQALRSKALKSYQNSFLTKNIRIVLHHPPNGALRYLTECWAEVLTFMGIQTTLLDWGQDCRTLLDNHSSTVFITVADPTWWKQIDRDYLKRLHREGHLKVGMITTLEHRFDPCDFNITFHLDPGRDPRFAALDKPIISLPFATNPLRHFMQSGEDVWDYFFVGTNSPLKRHETEAWLTPIVKHSRGMLAGVNWATGIGELSMTDSSLFYNFARIYPNYHLSKQREQFNELNERTYIIPACGGFQIVDNPAAMSELFATDEIVVATSPREYRELFDYYLRHPEKRLPYIQKGMQRVWRDYTLFVILSRLARFLGISDKNSLKAASLSSPSHSDSAAHVTP